MNQDQLVELRRVDQRHQTFRTMLRCGLGLGAAYFASKGIEALAGSNTSLIIDTSMKFLANFTVILPAGIAAATSAWAVGERKLRQKKTGYLQDRIKQLEAGKDPDRTSSGLTRTGETNPKDKIQ